MPNEPHLVRIADDLAPTTRDGAGDGYAVFVASDVRLYSEGLALVFAADGRLHVSHVADTAERTVLFLRETGADALLLDASMQGARAVLDAVSARAPTLPIILFGVSALTGDLVDCIDAGATAFVSRDATSRELMLTVLAAVRGEALLSLGPLAHIAVHSEHGPPMSVQVAGTPIAGTPRTDPLTARERELAALLDEGLSNKEIAQRLSISVATVKNHVHRILEKLHIERRGQAASRLRRTMNLRI